MTKPKRQFSSSLIGQRLIEAGYLTQEQLDKALAQQMETGLLFGEVCLLHGWITFDQLKECLPPMRSKIGQRLLESGVITMEQLYLALVEQRSSGCRLGHILIARGWVEESKLMATSHN